jgi:hypothetical protein
MMKFIEILFALFIIVPLIRELIGYMTVPGGLIYSVTNATAVNGTATNTGAFELVYWQAFPWLIGLFLIVAIFRMVSGRFRRDENQPPPMR